MRIAFALNTLGFLRHFEQAIGELVARGHRIMLIVIDRSDPGRLPESLESSRAIEVVEAPIQRPAPLGPALRLVRSVRDYVRYHEPPFRHARLLRGRALERLVDVSSGESREFSPPWAEWSADLTATERERTGAMFDEIERAMPSDPRVDSVLLSQRPDVLLVTPLVTFGSALPDWVKSAKRLGIPVGFPVFSWDNLSTKGAIHERPDRVLVWNEVQKREAVEMHGVPAADVVVTGAPRFDTFFAMAPSESWETVCRRLRFDPARPVITYLGSSPMVAPDEPKFTKRWVASLRQSAEASVRTANILVRPHPRTEEDWIGWWTDEERVAVSGTGSLAADQALFDAIHHASVVVALNTSAQLEAGILGKPVLTLLAPEDAPGQSGTLHFEYLLESNGGFVKLASSIEEHAGQLAYALSGTSDTGRIQRFIGDFLRPAGIARAAAPIFADAVEALGALRQAPADAGWLTKLKRRVGLEPAAAAVSDHAATALLQLELRQAKERADLMKQKTRELRRALNASKGAGAAVAEDDDPVAPAKPAPATAAAPAVVRLDYPHTEIKIVVSSEPERKWRATACAKEPWTVKWLDTYVQPGDVVYDIGANVGVFSLIAASRLKGRGLVVAFEPGSANYAHLCDNIVLNGYDTLIAPVPLPLTSSNGLQAFTYKDRDPGQSRHTFDAQPWQPGAVRGRRYTQPVLAVTLDHLVSQFALPTPVHVKLDVDGAEPHVLQGGLATLAAPSMRSLLMEIDLKNEARVLDLLAQAGLRLEHREARQKKDRELKTWYGLFVRGQ